MYNLLVFYGINLFWKSHLFLLQSVELATPNSLVLSEEAFKGICIKGTFSFVSFDYVCYIFPQLLIQIAMKFLGLDYMIVG